MVPPSFRPLANLTEQRNEDAKHTDSASAQVNDTLHKVFNS